MSGYSTRRHGGPVRFSWYFLDYVREAAIGGMTTNAEIAQVLQRRDPRITTRHVTTWRNEVPDFERVCACALIDANVAVSNVIYKAAIAGDLQAARYWNDRRNPAFLPKSRSENVGGENLDDTLRRRSYSDDDLRKDGVIKDDDAE